MSKLPRIRTPLTQHIRRIRYQLIPVLTFLTAGCLTIWLWAQHAGMPNAVGAVEVMRYEMAAPAAGILIPIPDGSWQPFDQITADTVIARLDPQATGAAMTVIREEVARLRKQLIATDAQLRVDIAEDMRDEANYQRRRRVEIRDLAIKIEDLRLDILDRTAQLETERVRLDVLDVWYEAMKEVYDRDAAGTEDMLTVEIDRDTAAENIKGWEKALSQAKEDLGTAVKRKADAIKELDSFAATVQPPVDTEIFLEPIRGEIAVQEARMEELEIQKKSLVVKAPVSGMISEIYCRPGQFVRAGEAILAIAVGRKRHVVSYIRETQKFRPTVGMAVKVRVRSVPIRTIEGRVEGIGPEVAGVPRHHLRDPTYREWGLPVRIRVDEDLGLPPGELVDITFIIAR